MFFLPLLSYLILSSSLHTSPLVSTPVFSSYSSQLLSTLLPFPLSSSTLLSSSLLLLFHLLPSSLPPPSFLLCPPGSSPSPLLFLFKNVSPQMFLFSSIIFLKKENEKSQIAKSR